MYRLGSWPWLFRLVADLWRGNWLEGTALVKEYERLSRRLSEDGIGPRPIGRPRWLMPDACVSETNVGMVCMLVIEPRRPLEPVSQSRVAELTLEVTEAA